MTKLWKISQSSNQGSDTYTDAIVAADSENAARYIHPDGHYHDAPMDWGKGTWAPPSDVKVELIGTAVRGIKKGTVVLVNFQAG